MNNLTIAIVALRAAALAVSFNDQAAGERLHTLANLVEAGRTTDAHMQEVAEKLKLGAVTAADWDELLQRIDADAATLHGG